MTWYITALLYLWKIFKEWLSTMFVLPFTNTDMLWLLVPIWISWFFAEFFQEKIGTSMGNALTNSVVILWGSIDSTRQTIRLIGEGVLNGIWDAVLRFAVITVIFLYGALIVVLGIRGNPIIKKIARVREISYLFVMFVPIFYNALPFSFDHIVAAVIFFPLFYFIIELVNKLMPNPKALQVDLEKSSGNSNNSLLEPSSIENPGMRFR
ncbi:MAG TPA: hypothetical protein DCE80_02885 [Ignavibacteriales bacterium]|nr:hypothetical protein [Ignavibacteriales bacterium]